MPKTWASRDAISSITSFGHSTTYICVAFAINHNAPRSPHLHPSLCPHRHVIGLPRLSDFAVLKFLYLEHKNSNITLGDSLGMQEESDDVIIQTNIPIFSIYVGLWLPARSTTRQWRRMLAIVQQWHERRNGIDYVLQRPHGRRLHRARRSVPFDDGLPQLQTRFQRLQTIPSRFRSPRRQCIIAQPPFRQ